MSQVDSKIDAGRADVDVSATEEGEAASRARAARPAFLRVGVDVQCQAVLRPVRCDCLMRSESSRCR